MKRPKIVCGWGSAPDPDEAAYDAPQAPSRLGRGPAHFSPIDAFDRCSWAFVGIVQKGKMDTRNY